MNASNDHFNKCSSNRVDSLRRIIPLLPSVPSIDGSFLMAFSLLGVFLNEWRFTGMTDTLSKPLSCNNP